MQFQVGELVSELINGSLTRFTDNGEYVVEYIEDAADEQGDDWGDEADEDDECASDDAENEVLQATIDSDGMVTRLISFRESVEDGDVTSEETDHLDPSGNFGSGGQNYRKLLTEAGVSFQEPWL